MRRGIAILLLVLAGCAGSPERAPEPDEGTPRPGETSPEEVPEAPHERFLENPTVIKARSIHAILPATYRKDVRVSGLTAGWREEDGRSVWEGTGEAEVRIRKLVLSGPSIRLTLVASQAEPEVQILADGDVSFGHVAKGLGTEWEGKEFLMIRNDRWLER